MPENFHPTVGYIGHPPVAQALRELGFKVITAAAFRDAATAISNELKATPFPVVVAETDAIGFAPWVSSVASKTKTIVLRTRPDLGHTVGGAHVLDLPATINQLLPLLGYQPSLSAAGELTILAETPAAQPVNPSPVPLAAVSPPADLPAAPVSEPPFEPPAPEYRFRDDLPEIFHGHDPIQDVEPVAEPVVDTGDDDDLFDITPPAAAPVLMPAPRPAPIPPAYSPPAQPAPPALPSAPQLAPPAQYHPPTPIVTVEPPAPASQPYVPPAVAQPAPHLAGDDDLFDSKNSRHTNSPSASAIVHHGRGELLICMAGKGGVGKTSQALLAAKIASEAGLRTVLVDGNRGQADVRSYLRLPPDQLPSIYDFTQTGDPASAIILPSFYNPYRPVSVEPLDFAIVQAPPRHLASPDVVTADTYARVIDYARNQADLVILDTQILEAHKTDLFERLIIPALLSGAWSVSIVNDSRAAADNLLDGLADLAGRGVSNAHSLIIASLYEEFDENDRRAVERKYGQYGSFIGAVGTDPSFKDQLNVGNILTTSPAMAPVTRAILYRVTGNSAFAPIELDPGRGKKRRRLFGRRNGSV